MCELYLPTLPLKISQSFRETKKEKKMSWRLLLSSSSSIKPFPLLPPTPQKPIFTPRLDTQFHPHNNKINGTNIYIWSYARGSSVMLRAKSNNGDGVLEEGSRKSRRAQQIALWAAEAAYIIWLFLLPCAPGDPIWAIKSSTINDLIGLSLNFFFVLPILNYAGIHVIESPLLHPVSEGLFNFVIAWTLLFAPLLFTDRQRDRYKGSLDILWGFQMFLTNTFLIPYMAIRLDDKDSNYTRPPPTRLASLMTSGASVVGLVGGAVCLFSLFWALFARSDDGFGGLAARWDFFTSYIGSERLAYAFIWDIFLYAIFQPWLIGDNLQNVRQNNERTVRNLRFIPVVGLIAYLVSLDNDKALS